MAQDDGVHEDPTYDNIINAFRRLVAVTEAGDSCFFHYSGHGGRVADTDGDEDDGYDETLIPVDYQSSGQIRDDVVYSELVGRMPEGSTLTCLMDCCHSGSVLDLPYTFKADGEEQEMHANPRVKMGRLQQMAAAFLIQRIFGSGAIAQIVSSTIAMGGMSGQASVGLLQQVSSMICASS